MGILHEFQIHLSELLLNLSCDILKYCHNLFLKLVCAYVLRVSQFDIQHESMVEQW